MSDLSPALPLTTPLTTPLAAEGAGLRLPARLAKARGVAMTAALAVTPLMMLAGLWADWRAQAAPPVAASVASLAAPAGARSVAQAPSPR